METKASRRAAMAANATLKSNERPVKASTQLRQKRKPLGDCSNTITSLKSSQSSSSSSLFKPINPSVSSAFNSLFGGIESNSRSISVSDGSTQNGNKDNLVDVASVLSPPPKFQSLTGIGDVDVFRTAYSRRSTSEKRQTRSQAKVKAITGPLSCTRTRTINIRDEANKGEDIGLPKSHAVHRRKKTRIVKSGKENSKSKEDVSMHALPQDFIEKQRAYFAEIDAFELPEEEVAPGEEME